MGFVNEKTEDGVWRTIDKRRNIILVRSRPPRPEEGYEFELTIDNQIVRFLGHSGMKIHGSPSIGEPRQYDMNWEIYRLFIPVTLQGRKDEITSLIREALKVYGHLYDTQRASSVSINFSPNLI